MIKKYYAVSLLICIIASGCSKQEKKEVKKEDTVEQLVEKATAYITKEKYPLAAETLEKLISKNADHPDIHTYKLLLADTYFKATNYASATTMYEHFNQHYPADPKAEYAKYQSVLSQFYQTLKVGCDQKPTKATINLCKQYLDTRQYLAHRKDVEDIMNTCEHKLINKEIYVFDFYIKNNQLQAAQSRLDYLKKTYGTKKASLEPRLLYLECKLAQRQKNDDSVKKNLDVLLNKYPESQYTYMAHALTSKPKFSF